LMPRMLGNFVFITIVFAKHTLTVWNGYQSHTNVRGWQ